MNDASPSGPDQLPLSALVSIALRWLPLIAVLAAAAGAAAYVVLGNEEETPEATVTLGLTEAVRWPFFEPVRGRLAMTVDSTLVSDVRTQLGDESIDVQAEIPDALAVVDIIATADRSDTALAAADVAADLVLSRVDGSRQQEVQATIDASRAEIQTIQAEVDAAEQRLDELFDARAAAQSEIEIRRIEDEISTTQRLRNTNLQDVLNLESSIDESEIELLALQPEASVVGRELSSESSSSRRLTVAAAVGLAVGIFATLAALILSAERGAVRSSQHLAVVSEREVREWPAGESAGLVRWLTERTEPSMRVGVLGADGQGWAGMLSQSVGSLVGPERLPAFADIAPGAAVEHLLQCDRAVLVVPENTSLVKVNKSLTWLDDSEIPLAGLLYRSNGSSRHR